ncbi:hypothetical protein C8F01DRAFT_1268139 [Mycena amicta]|nr:hypothetical protein C8F01DRAFT_1268139 [Mycena amicta]
MLVSIKNITFHATYTAHSPCSRIARSALSRLDSFPPDLPRLGSMQLECLVDGSPFACTLDLQVAEGLPADIILGADWHLLLVAERSQAHPDTPQAQSSAFPHVPKPQASPVVVAEERRDGPRLPTHAHSVDPPDLSPEPAGARRDDLREILQTRGVTFDPDDGTAKLRRTLKKHIHALQKGKGSKPLSYAEKVRERLEHEDALDEVRAGNLFRCPEDVLV